MKWFFDRKIGTKISLAVGLILGISLMLQGIFALSSSTKALEDNTKNFALKSVNEASRLVDQILKSQLNKVQGVSMRTEVKTMNWEIQEKTLLKDLEQFEYLRFNIIDTKGNARSTDGTTADLSERAYFKKALEGTSNVSDPLLSKFDNKMVIVFASPIRADDGKIIGVLSATADYMTISKLITDIKMRDEGNSFIINSKGLTIAHPDPERVKNGLNVLEEVEKKPEYKSLAAVMNNMVTGQIGTANYEYNGIENFIAYAPIKETQWFIGLSVPRNVLFKDVEALKVQIIGIIFLFVILGISLSIFFVREIITRPIRNLLKMSEKLAAGSIDIKINQNDRKDEIGLLTRSFEDIVAGTKNKIHAAQKIAQGDLNIEIKVMSEEDVLSKSMDKVVETLNSVVDETGKLTAAAVEGQLSQRGNPSQFKGVYKEIIEGINNTLDAVIAPVKETQRVLESMSEGRLDISTTGDYKGDHAAVKNSLNQTIAFISNYVKEISYVLREISNKNMEVEVNGEYKGDFIEIKKSLNLIINSLNDFMDNINNSAEQVSSGSRQIADSSQVLSHGATEQASAVEELNESISVLAEKTRQNALIAAEASELADHSRTGAQKSNEHMEEMLLAIKEINDSSQNISKIIKVIDEIAFQTNILALNAAVEAARAGQYGKGFAVVAEEVRNLASRSASAAKETTDLIEGSIKSVDIGTKIANDTANSLKGIVDYTTKAAGLMKEIADASNQQASGIAQINQNINHVSQVVQTNSATSEEGAAASEELSSQAEVLKQMVGEFRLKSVKSSSYGDLDGDIIEMLKNRKERPEKKSFESKNQKSKINLGDSGFGKY